MLQSSDLKYPLLLLEVCPDGVRACASETKPVIGWSGSKWKGFRAVCSEASRPAESNEVTLSRTRQAHTYSAAIDVSCPPSEAHVTHVMSSKTTHLTFEKTQL